MSESNEVRKVCPLCGTVRRDFAARAGLRKVWTCFYCRRTFWPPRNKDSVLFRIRMALSGESRF
jgi:hypothetical protein